MCYEIHAHPSSYSDTGLLTIYSGTGRDQVPELLAVVVDELKRSAEDLSEVEVARARAQLKAGLLMGLEQPSSRAERLAQLLLIWDRVPSIEETIEKVDSVSVQSVRDAAAGLASSGAGALALYGPVRSAPTVQDLTDKLAA